MPLVKVVRVVVGVVTAALHTTLAVAHGGGWTTNLPRLVG